MILIILLQRGRGGGLAGALGGAGGQSAFGAKAGDTFTRITIVTAVIWFTLCLLAIRIMNPALRTTADRSGLSSGEVIDVGSEEEGNGGEPASGDGAPASGDGAPASGDAEPAANENKDGKTGEAASGDQDQPASPPAEGEADNAGKPEEPPANKDESGGQGGQ